MANNTLGVSLSLHRCKELRLSPQRLLRAALHDTGCRRFRLMSYWNIHEPENGRFDYRALDKQMDLIAEFGGKVTLCIGKRQPRWPECHIPDWAIGLGGKAWYAPLYDYLELTVLRYKRHPALESWQLENEALLRTFGACKDKDYNRKRLQEEAEIVRSLDGKHPLIMSLSNSWGIPFRKPQPDRYAISVYRRTIDPRGNIRQNMSPAFLYRIRCDTIQLLSRRRVFIHELQAEPWVTGPIANIPVEQQLRIFNPKILRDNYRYAMAIRHDPIYFWGLEWWYWLKVRHRQPAMWEAAGTLFWENARQR